MGQVGYPTCISTGQQSQGPTLEEITHEKNLKCKEFWKDGRELVLLVGPKLWCLRAG